MRTQVWTGIQRTRTMTMDDRSPQLPAVRAVDSSSSDKTANIILLDTSGSTKEPLSARDSRPKLIGGKEAITMFVSRIPASAWLGLVAFADLATTLIPLQPIEERLNLIRAVQGCAADGGTALNSALRAAEDELGKAPGGYMKRLYCITDGMPTDDGCRTVAKRLKASGVQLHFIGVGQGDEIDESLMRELASRSNSGDPLYRHFSEAKQLSTFMSRESRTITC